MAVKKIKKATKAKKATTKKKSAPKNADKVMVENAVKRLSADFKKAKTKLLKAEKDIKDFIKKNPKKAARIAAGVGTAVGLGIAAAIIKHKKK